MGHRVTVEYIDSLLKEWDFVPYSELRVRDSNLYIIDDEIKNHIISENSEFKDIIKPIYTNRGFKGYYSDWYGTWIVDINLKPKLI